MIKPLTSLRFVFAMMVFLSHLDFLYPKGVASFNWLYEHIFYEGYIGVGFFFMLSGFILSYTYKRSFLDNTISKKDYLIKRIARIYPLHLITLYISIPIFIIEIGKNAEILTKQLVANLLLLQSFGPDRSYFFSFNALSWSISNELFFYLCLPFLILLFYHYKFLSRIILIAACIAIPFVMPNVVGNVEQHTLFYINPFVRLIDFTIGIFLFDIYELIKNKNIKQYATVLEFLSVIMFSCFLYFHNNVPQVFRWSCYYWIPIAFIILTFSFQAGKLSLLLSNKVIVFLGEISFGIYMFHQLVIRYYKQLDADFSLIDNPYIAGFVVLSISIVISGISYYVIEKPVNIYLVRKFTKKRIN